MTGRNWLLGLLLLFGMWLGPYQIQRARATTMTVAVSCFAGPCFNDGGIRSNGVGVLGFNRYALLPFSFFDANASLSGTVLVADLLFGRANYIYLYGQGVGTQSVGGGGFFLSSAISQIYRTIGGTGKFGAFNIGACNATAVDAGDGTIMTPLVNGVALTGGVGTTACTPFAQLYPLQRRSSGAYTKLTATDTMQFNAILGGGARITLPWGGDLPDPGATTLNTDIANSDSLATILGDLQSVDPGISQQVPEPATLALLGSGLLGLAALRRKRQA